MSSEAAEAHSTNGPTGRVWRLAPNSRLTIAALNSFDFP
jgi:hypothetical protein